MIDPGIFGSGTSSTVQIAWFVAGFAAVRFGFGWLDVQADLMPIGYFRGATKDLFVNLNPQLRINFARFYSLGVGFWGGATIVPTVEFAAGFSVSPAIFRFGDLGQHEVRFWLGSTSIATTAALRAGTLPLLLLSYAYVF